MSDLVKRLNIKAGVMEMGEKIAWGSDTALMREAAHNLATMQARIEALDDYCEKLRYQTVNQDAVIANLQARIEALEKAICYHKRDVIYDNGTGSKNDNRLWKALESLLEKGE